jgi:hypothetical protein
MEKADEKTNVNGETSFIGLVKELSIQGGVEMNNATPLEGNSVILGDQDIVLNGDDQKNDSLDSSIKLTWKHMKKIKQKVQNC